MKKIGFVGVAEATTFNGDVNEPPVVGLVTVSGKSLEPGGGGIWAGGAGSGLVCGDHEIVTGGVDGYVGCEGVVVVVAVEVALVPHPLALEITTISMAGRS